MSRILEEVASWLGKVYPEHPLIQKDVRSHGNVTTVTLLFDNPELDCYWVEASTEDKWWYGFPGENGCTEKEPLLEFITKKIEKWERDNEVTATD
ncbi:hypothetical protein D1R32_gp376 [Tunisvirus fontaine2]|uniref:Uncharacterized protein n=1 Tax=Tunisvirus fontaine2 TaxID=1421067 RepID=V9SDX9_9VIRU|nr:hypothetical protein D1R32_gp376 [Tunisvirus fontaine2]AHC55093.1 hypothetical protein TNS_ORF375 [Tunisvirus fontaine2]